MNEIKRALATLQDLLDNSIFTSRIDFALEVAIEALREKAEREKEPITFCPKCNRLTEYDSHFNRRVCTNAKCNWRSKKSDSRVTHNGEHFCFFCSYCGKRLEVEHE